MGQSMSKNTVAAIVAVVVLLLGLVAWKVFGPGAAGVSESERQAEFRLNQQHGAQMESGQPPVGPPGSGTGIPGSGTGIPPGPGTGTGIPPGPR
jgi:hypothetical protein